MIYHKPNILSHYLIVILLVSCLFNCANNTDQKIEKTHKYTNELINETSPYLLQHAHNPVDWKSWNPKTLQQAKKENKLIIISIGYSACHWCHVMEEESFKNDSVASIMNDNFISIKIDKEERPDINQIYLNAVELMTGSGGWPLNCIALPDGRPIFGGTYFTKEEWKKALNDIKSVYKKNPEKVLDYAEKLTEGIKKSELITLNKEKTLFKIAALNTYVENWNSYLDFNNGGQQTNTKFPLPNDLSFQLRHSIQNKDENLKKYTYTTLKKMAYGGIYDQIGGGFSRYAVDEKWHIPHFEKMLYDNAQLVSLYSEAYLATKDKLYKNIVLETLNFVKRELTDINGAFYSSLDADSFNENNELEEGAFYSWTKSELQNIITKDYSLFEAYYNINDFGKWEENNYVLIRNVSNANFASTHNISIEALESKIKLWKKNLFNARQKRNAPRLDDKILTSWNASMLKGYVDAYRVFGDPSYLETAKKNATFLINKQLKTNGVLNHNYKDGKSSINGYLEDYASLIEALISLYQVTFNEVWLEKAKELTDYTNLHFKDETTQMFYFTSDTDDDLIARKIQIIDNVIPSSNSIMAHNLFKLGHYYADSEYSKQAKQMLTNIVPKIDDSPSAYSNWLSLITNYSNPYYEVAISGTNALEKTKEINSYYLPNILIAGALKESQLPLMKNRYVDNATYIYVCVNGTCKLPLTDIKKTIQLIKK